MARALKHLSHDADNDLKKKAGTARWTGVNKQVTQTFIDKTAGEFDDAHTEAQTIVNILKDTRGELITFRNQLQDAMRRAQHKNLVVKDTGKGTFEVTYYPERVTVGPCRRTPRGRPP